MSKLPRSLREFYPGRYEIPILMILSIWTLVRGLSLPLVNVEKMVLWKSTYSVFTGVMSLIEVKEYLLGSVLFFFSIIFPLTKLAALGVIWFIRLPEERRSWLLHWLEVLGKWSMLDVFIVAILIVAVKLGPLANIEPRPGIYYFCAAILLSMITTMWVDHLAQRSIRK